MKNSQHLRIFLTTSQICTVYGTMLAKNSHQQNDVDILFIDGSKRKQGLIDLITKTSKIYPWTLLHDFSIPMGEDHDYNPTIGKNITRHNIIIILAIITIFVVVLYLLINRKRSELKYFTIYIINLFLLYICNILFNYFIIL